MICIASAIIFAILGIFSLSYRKLAKEAFECVARRIAFRPCDVGFAEKIKAMFIGKLMSKNEKVARFFHKHIEIVSWIFVILVVLSTVYTANTVYNLIRYQTCNPDEPEACILTPESEECSPSEHCDPCNCGDNEENCTAENNYAPCGGEENCDCNETCEENLK